MFSVKEENKEPDFTSPQPSWSASHSPKRVQGDLIEDVTDGASTALLGATVTVRLGHARPTPASRSAGTGATEKMPSAPLTGTLLEVRRLWIPPESRRPLTRSAPTTLSTAAKRWRLPPPAPSDTASTVAPEDTGPLLAYVRLKEGDHRLSGWVPLAAVEVKELAATSSSAPNRLSSSSASSGRGAAAAASAAPIALPASLATLVSQPVLSRIYWRVTAGMARTLRSQKQLDYLEERLLRDCQTPTSVRFMVYLDTYLFAPWYYAPYGLLHGEYDPLGAEAVCARQTSAGCTCAVAESASTAHADQVTDATHGLKSRRTEGDDGADSTYAMVTRGPWEEQNDVKKVVASAVDTQRSDDEGEVVVLPLTTATVSHSSASIAAASRAYVTSGRLSHTARSSDCPTARAFSTSTADDPTAGQLPNAPPKTLRVNPFIRDAYLCPFSLRLFSSASQMRHEISQYRVDRLRPPGVELYRDTERGFSLFEVNGSRDVTYCRHLFLLGKSFLENKLAGHDVHNYYFYVVCLHQRHAPQFIADTNAMYFASYFTWEKQVCECNLACVVTLPCFGTHGGRNDRTTAAGSPPCGTLKGLGQFMIAVSYELAYRRRQVGSPEKPLSDLGAAAYQRYWQRVLLKWMAEQVDQHERDVAIHISSASNSLSPTESTSQEAPGDAAQGRSLRLKDIAEQVRLEEADVHTTLLHMGVLHRCADDRSTQLLIPEKFVRWAVAREAASQKRIDVAVFSPDRLRTKKQAMATAPTATVTQATPASTSYGKRR